jgi:carboxyl-terminal processing protease
MRSHKHLRKLSVLRFPVALLLVFALVVAALVFPAPTAKAAGSDFSLLELCLQLIQGYYPGEFDLSKMVESAAKGFVRAIGDPYSDYLTQSEYESLMSGLSGGFGGLGIYIDEAADGYIVIVSPIAGTPAEEAGLRPGDKIAEVDGEDFRFITVNEASSRLRGDPGTKVTLGILRAGASGMLTFEITRAWIEIDPVEYEMSGSDVGLIRLTSFNELTTQRLDQAIQALKGQGARGIVLDLRNNGGGLLDQAFSVADRFLRPGQVVLNVIQKSGDPEVRTSSGQGYVDLPLVVLVNEGTASASEIVAGAIKDNDMGTLVGTTTYGKGSIQNVWFFAAGGGLKLTTARFATPAGVLIEGEGIQPHETVEEPWDQVFLPYLDWYRPIRHMRVGLDVLSLEEVLNYLALSAEPVDGVYGMTSVNAVKAFQKAKGLYVTGVVDDETAAALNQAARDKQGGNDPQLERGIELIAAAIR